MLPAIGDPDPDADPSATDPAANAANAANAADAPGAPGLPALPTAVAEPVAPTPRPISPYISLYLPISPYISACAESSAG